MNLPDRSRSPLFDCSSPTARGLCSSPRKKPLWRFPSAPISQEPSQWDPRWDLSRTRPSISPPVRWVPSRSVRMHGTRTTLRLAPTSTSCQLHSAPNSSLLAKTRRAQIPNQNHSKPVKRSPSQQFKSKLQQFFPSFPSQSVMEEPTENGSRPLPSLRAVEYIARGVRLLQRSIIDMWDIRSETQRLVSAILPPSSLSPPGPQSAQETLFTFPILCQASARTASSRDSASGVPPLKRSILQVDPTQQTEGDDTPILGKWGCIILSSFERTQGRNLLFRATLNVTQDEWIVSAEVVFTNAGWKKFTKLFFAHDRTPIAEKRTLQESSDD